MSINNIISGFRCTGIYPFNPSIIPKKLPKDSEQKANDDEVGMSLESGADTVQPKPLKVAEFSPEELERFENRFENGYDIFTDEKYMAWLRQYHPDSVPQDLCDDPLNTTLNDPFNESPFDEYDYQPDGDGNFSQEELERFEKRFENGYDIFTDEKYVAWLQEYHPNSEPSVTSVFASVSPLEESAALLEHEPGIVEPL